MTTYNTYQEAKIANPECEIYQLERNGLFAHCDHHKAELVRFVEFDSAGVKCNPADHCMTVEKFLADGYKFVDGDIYMCKFGDINVAGDRFSPAELNKPDYQDALRYILRAAALEEKKPLTRVEYVGVNANNDAFWEVAREFAEDGVEFRSSQDNCKINDNLMLLTSYSNRSLQRRIETPITWQDELYDYLDNSCEMDGDFDDDFTLSIDGRPLEFNLSDDEFVDMCKFVASLNSVS